MSDSFASHADTAEAPARRAAAVVPNDGADLAEVPKCLWVAAAGTVSIVAVNDAGNAGTAMGNLPAGAVIPVRVRRVRATGTTAALVAFY